MTEYEILKRAQDEAEQMTALYKLGCEEILKLCSEIKVHKNYERVLDRLMDRYKSDNEILRKPRRLSFGERLRGRTKDLTNSTLAQDMAAEARRALRIKPEDIT